MNPVQRRALAGVAGLIGLMVLFPPFEFRPGYGAVVNLGYGFLLAPPSFREGRLGSVNVSLLALEILAACIVGGAAHLVLGTKKS